MWRSTRNLIHISTSKNVFNSSRFSCQTVSKIFNQCFIQTRGASDDSTFSSVFKPVSIKSNADKINIGAEFTGEINKGELLKILNKLTLSEGVKALCKENGIDHNMQKEAFASFRRFCLESANLPAELHIMVSDVVNGHRHIDDLFPYFLSHARDVFPHLNCIDDLKQISDLRTPANWYPEARVKARRIIFHAGPTNSGKTFQAMQRFLEAKSGVYCGPLKLLATEVFNKSNAQGTPCDLVTGEERRFGNSDGSPSSHVACTVEMTSLSTPYEVAIIDEIQMLKDPGRGWAWTRAFLGINAEEIHVCGEAATIGLIERLCETTGEVVESHHYNRLTELTIEDTPLGSLENVQPGDCIVCFSKNDIYTVSREIESMGKQIAVIYGSLPPNTKLAQAAKFNDFNNSCKVMVATDAIGMGLNLSIRRIIFYTITKPQVNERGEKEVDYISVSSALQIAGRAGRFRTQWEHGYVTTFNARDLPVLHDILSQAPEPAEQAGLHPTAEQIELYAYHLPDATLSNLMDIFVSLCTVDDLYFMCAIDDFKRLAEMIQHVPLPLRARYVFCCSPIDQKRPFITATFLKYAREYSKNEPITFDWLAKNCGWPLQVPKSIVDLIHLETVFDIMDLYLWLSYRFPDMFPQAHVVREAQVQLDDLIQQGVLMITRLLKNKSGAKDITEPTLKWSPISSVGLGGGKLTNQLLNTGVITQAMLQQLQNEWIQDDGSKKAQPNDFEQSIQRSKKSKKEREQQKLSQVEIAQNIHNLTREMMTKNVQTSKIEAKGKKKTAKSKRKYK